MSGNNNPYEPQQPGEDSPEQHNPYNNGASHNNYPHNGGPGSQPPQMPPYQNGPYNPSQPPATATGAIGYGWKKFGQHAGPLLGATVVVGLVLGAFSNIVVMLVGGGYSVDDVSPLATALTSLAGYIVGSAYIRGILAILNGDEVKFSGFFTFSNIGNVAILALILSAVSLVLGFVPILGPLVSLVVSVLTAFALWFVVADNLAAVDAIKASFDLVTKNLGFVIVLILLSILLFIAGLLALIVGVFIAIPIIVIAQGFAFNSLQGRLVAP